MVRVDVGGGARLGGRAPKSRYRAWPRSAGAGALARRGLGRVTRRASAVAVVTVAALAAGGCGTTSPTADLFQMPNMTSQTLMNELELPTSPAAGYPMIAGPEHLSLLGIQYTTQGRAVLQSWLNAPPATDARHKQAGRNLAVAFPGYKAQIYRKLG